MGFFDRAYGGMRASVPGPADDFWYQPAGAVSSSGIPVTPEGAQRVSAFYRGVDLLSTSLAMLPLNVYLRLADDKGSEIARDHPLYAVLHMQPNVWQDSFQWRRQAARHVIMRGNAYSRIVPGARGFADQLWPMAPDRVTVKQLSNGRLTYEVRQDNGTPKTYTQDEVLHLRGVSDDGIRGVGVVRWAMDSLGLTMAVDAYAQRLFSQGSLYGTVVDVPQKPTDEQKKDLRANLAEATSGLHNAHAALITWGGMKVTRDAMTGEETQFVASRKFGIEEIARWLGLPPHMLGSLDNATFSNIEHQGQEFVTYSLGPWLALFESAFNTQLILDPTAYFTEFVRDALVRGDIAARWAAYTQAVSTGTVTRNEVRQKENMPALPGLDTPLDPAHLTGKQSQANQPPPPEDDADDDAEASARDAYERKVQAITQSAAARLLRKEVAAVQKAAVRNAMDEDAFAVAVTDFYAAHVAIVVDTLQMVEADAKVYCANQARQVLTDWTAALALWGTEAYAAGVAAIALEDAA